MSYLVTASRGQTAFAGSARTAAYAVEWIRTRRAEGAGDFVILDDRDSRINETALKVLAMQEIRSFQPKQGAGPRQFSTT